MNEIRIKCPAKINLTLEIVNRREDGFHNIKSIMQLVSLYDFLTIKKTKSGIELSGTSPEIPYDERNIVYKAAELFFESTQINSGVEIYIEKHIPISAGLAGGSTDAAGVLYGLNKLFGNKLTKQELEKLCSELGSDLNVCLNGGCTLATSRGEITEPLPCIQSSVTLIKPKHLGISAGEAYKKYALKEFKPKNNMTEKMMYAINSKENIKPYLYNDLEYAIFDDYKELQQIKQCYPNSIMSGSGSTYFVLENLEKSKLGDDFEFINELNFISNGVSEYDS